ncbi:hypothetical protein GCM10023322_08720 [Rugosimonospora acidiphila]|uniref:Uncharacterized protein n=1 Tax=Rugosimonospora acidiphila TaxID=556531 RepID=A0ABP9RLI4_9ACTN
MRDQWIRRHLTTVALIVGALAVLVMLSQSRLAATGIPVVERAGVTAVHSAAVHSAPWSALRAPRSRTRSPRGAPGSGAVIPASALALALLLLLGSGCCRLGGAAASRKPGGRGPPPFTG